MKLVQSSLDTWMQYWKPLLTSWTSGVYRSSFSSVMSRILTAIGAQIQSFWCHCRSVKNSIRRIKLFTLVCIWSAWRSAVHKSWLQPFVYCNSLDAIKNSCCCIVAEFHQVSTESDKVTAKAKRVRFVMTHSVDICCVSGDHNFVALYKQVSAVGRFFSRLDPSFRVSFEALI